MVYGRIHWQFRWPCAIVALAMAVSLALVPAGDTLAQAPEVIPTPSPAGGSAPAQPIVSEVKIVGNRSVKENRVRGYLKTRTGRFFDAELAESDVRALIGSGLFRDVRIIKNPTPEGLSITFEVFERPTIQYLRIIGNTAVREKTLKKQLQFKEGDALNFYLVEESRRKLEEYYVSQGFPKVQVTILEGDKVKDKGVTYQIHEGSQAIIDGCKIVGSTIVTGERLKTVVQSKPGKFQLRTPGVDLFWFWPFRTKADMAKIDEDMVRLTSYYRALGFFRARVGRELEYSKSGDSLVVTFVVDEGPRCKVRNITVVGNKIIGNEKLTSNMELKAGEFYNQARMNRDLKKIQDEYGGIGHIFADVKADPRLLEEGDQVDMVYDIREGDRYRIGRVDVQVQGAYPHTRRSVVMRYLSFQPGQIVDNREIQMSKVRLTRSQLFESNPQNGQAPQIVVKPREQDALARELEEGEESTSRGQSPDPSGFDSSIPNHNAFDRNAPNRNIPDSSSPYLQPRPARYDHDYYPPRQPVYTEPRGYVPQPRNP